MLHEAAGALAKESEPPPDTLEAKVEICFLTWAPWQAGQVTSLVAAALRTSSSKGLPQSSHTNSKMGIQALSMGRFCRACNASGHSGFRCLWGQKVTWIAKRRFGVTWIQDLTTKDSKDSKGSRRFSFQGFPLCFLRVLRVLCGSISPFPLSIALWFNLASPPFCSSSKIPS